MKVYRNLSFIVNCENKALKRYFSDLLIFETIKDTVKNSQNEIISRTFVQNERDINSVHFSLLAHQPQAIKNRIFDENLDDFNVVWDIGNIQKLNKKDEVNIFTFTVTVKVNNVTLKNTYYHRESKHERNMVIDFFTDIESDYLVDTVYIINKDRIKKNPTYIMVDWT